MIFKQKSPKIALINPLINGMGFEIGILWICWGVLVIVTI